MSAYCGPDVTRREVLGGAIAFGTMVITDFNGNFISAHPWKRELAPRDTDGPEWDKWLEEYEKHQCGVLSQD